MADLKISQLNELAGSDLAAGDAIAVVDDSASDVTAAAKVRAVIQGECPQPTPMLFEHRRGRYGN